MMDLQELRRHCTEKTPGSKVGMNQIQKLRLLLWTWLKTESGDVNCPGCCVHLGWTGEEPSSFLLMICAALKAPLTLKEILVLKVLEEHVLLSRRRPFQGRLNFLHQDEVQVLSWSVYSPDWHYCCSWVNAPPSEPERCRTSNTPWCYLTNRWSKRLSGSGLVIPEVDV